MIPQSATSISDFKQCPMLFFLRHVLRLRPVEEPKSLRMGTNWHRCLELLTDPCGGRDVMIEHLNQTYATCPPSVELTDWEIERIVLLYSALGWQWYHQDDEIETIAREVYFKRQVNNLYSRRGKIDSIIKRNGFLSLKEYKSTSKPIDSGSLYWDRLRLDTQPTFYLIEARHAQLAGELEQFGKFPADNPHVISGVLYDVWHKPTIRPKKLTQADSKKFVRIGEYFGEKFEVEHDAHGSAINGIEAEVTWGAVPKSTKKNPEPAIPFAIRETPEMFGARLLADIKEQPEKYFARKNIPRTDQELARFDEEYSNIARLTHFMTQRDLWFINENHCNATYRCAFTPICFYNLDVSDGNVPDGFKKG